MENFNLKKFLVENKLTTNSKMLNEDQQGEEYNKKLQRAQKNMLPLELDNYSYTPDPRYYEPHYRTISGVGGTSIPINNPDGTTQYFLKDEFKNTPITGTIEVNGKEYSIPDFYRNFYQGLL